MIEPAFPDIFIAKDTEEEYFKIYEIDIRTLPNGMKIGGIHRPIKDSYGSHVIFYFKTGAFFDPKGKEGLAHMIEHILSYFPDNIAKDNNVSFNASTAYEYIRISVTGIANPSVKDYGIWPVLKAIRQVLQDPFAGNDPHKILDREKVVVKREIHEVLPQRLRSFYKFTDSVLFSKEHPYNIMPTGSVEAVDTITVEDINSYLPKFVDPGKLIVRVVAEGPENTTKLINDTIQELFSDFPRPTTPLPEFDRHICDELNPSFVEGKTYMKFHDENPTPPLVSFLWKEEFPEYSKESVAQQHFMHFLDYRLFLFHRKTGLGYSSSTTIVRPGKKWVFPIISMSVPRRYTEDEARDLLAVLKKEVIQTISEEDLQKIVEKESKKQRAILIPASSRLDFAIDGIIDYGKVIAAEKIKKLHSELSVSDLQLWKERLLEDVPTIFLFQ
jgi:predicted Zn-dependent peptidase